MVRRKERDDRIDNVTMLCYTVDNETKHCYVNEVMFLSLISKKDLLAETGISYGQLYRWKRERLIPEEWFIKQSSYTGQETFFPREQVLNRVQSILELKDRYSLEELAKILSPESSRESIGIEILADIEEINRKILPELPELYGKEQFYFLDIVLLAALSQFAQEVGLTVEQLKGMIGNCASAGLHYKNADVLCTVFRAGGELHTAFSSGMVPVTFDRGVDILKSISLEETANQIKLKYKDRFAGK